MVKNKELPKNCQCFSSKVIKITSIFSNFFRTILFYKTFVSNRFNIKLKNSRLVFSFSKIFFSIKLPTTKQTEASSEDFKKSSESLDSTSDAEINQEESLKKNTVELSEKGITYN